MRAADCPLLAETTIVMLLARVAVWTLPFSTLRRAIERVRQPAETATIDNVARVSWAVNGVARRLPRMTCLVQALAADVLLRRRGYAPVLRLGVRGRPDAATSIEAHAWLECAGTIVVGRIADLDDYSLLTAPGRS